jgi:outer membrane lipoprotein-sorting protein
MSFRNQILLLVLIIALLGGCAGNRAISTVSSDGRKAPVFTRDMTLWPHLYRQNFAKITSFRGSARLTVESANTGGNVDLTTLWRSPDKLFLKAEGPLGLDIGKIFVGQKRFIWYNQYENHFTSGNLNDPYLNRFLQTNITLEDLKYTVLGFAGQAADSLEAVDLAMGIFASRSPEDAEISYRFRVNPQTGLLESVEALRQNRPFMRQDFKNYDVIKGIFFPRIVQVTMLDQKERVSVFYKKVQMNVNVDEKEFDIEVQSKVQQLNTY